MSAGETLATASARRTVELAARQSYGKLLAFLAARTRDVNQAEDALAEAFERALATWPEEGIPRSPEAWLLTAAKRRAIDWGRRQRTRAEAADTLHLLAEIDADGDDGPSGIPDDRLRLMFACAHPAIEASARTPLILQTLLGFDAAEIGSAFLVAPAAMGQRLVRAKRKIRDAGIPFRIPEPQDLKERLETVLDAIYAAYAEGWTDPAGTVSRGRDLSEEAIWLGRLVVSMLPAEPEAAGLLSLMLHVEARSGARRDANGNYVPLAEQDTGLWRADLALEAEALLWQAGLMGRMGRFQLEAALQSAHAARQLTGRTDWAAIVALYDALLAETRSPVVAINRAVALAELHGPSEGLDALDALARDPRLGEYQPYWAARAGLLASAGRDGADDAYERAIGLESDPAVRRFLQSRREGLGLVDTGIVGPR